MHINEDFTAYSKVADIGRWYVTQFVRQAAQQISRDAYLLDAGAGECVYRKFFPHCRYVGLDLAVGEPRWNYRNLDCIASLERLPFADASFDAVLSTQTLEHLDQPAECVHEIFRVLKPHGRLFLTAPMAHAEHQQPYDFFRYTSFGLCSLCRRAGFCEIAVRPFGGMFTRWAYELPSALSIFPRAGLTRLMLLPLKAITFVYVRMAQHLLLSLDRFDHAREYPFGWSLVATKRA